jgi:hypothetical protein
MDQTSYAFQVLSAMITPAVLISAAGLLVLSTSNRLSRVVDRVRALAQRVQNMKTEGSESLHRAQVLDQLSRLSSRAILLRSAMTAFYIAITFFVLTSISLGILSIFDWKHGWISVVTGLIGSAILLYGSMLLIYEGRHAIDATLEEMKFIRDSMSG